jgi:hypothetical protein
VEPRPRHPPPLLPPATDIAEAALQLPLLHHPTTRFPSPFPPDALLVADRLGHTRDYLRLALAPLDHEGFAIFFLVNRYRVIEFVPLFRGTVDGASVDPREVVKEALNRRTQERQRTHH